MQRNACFSYVALIQSQQIHTDDVSGTLRYCSAYYILKTRKQGSGRVNDWCKIAQLEVLGMTFETRSFDLKSQVHLSIGFSPSVLATLDHIVAPFFLSGLFLFCRCAMGTPTVSLLSDDPGTIYTSYLMKVSL